MPKLVDFLTDARVATYGLEVLAMERMGHSLADFSGCAERSSLSPADLLAIAHDALVAIAQLHVQANWLHLDIKPANLLLRRASSGASARSLDRVVLCDFEHARPVDLLLTKEREAPAGTVLFRSARADGLAAGLSVHPVPSWCAPCRARVVKSHPLHLHGRLR
jgi:serine/threonine protein kinase